MKDRLPTQILENGAIRYAEYSQNGEFLQYRYMVLDDEPTERGTPLNKKTFLTDETARLLWLSGDPTVNDAFNAIGHNGLYRVGDVFITRRTDLGEEWTLANGEAVADPSLGALTGLDTLAPEETTGIASSLGLSYAPIAGAVGNGYFLYYINDTTRIGYAPLSAIENGSLDFFTSGTEITNKFATSTGENIHNIRVLFTGEKFIYCVKTLYYYGSGDYDYSWCYDLGVFDTPDGIFTRQVAQSTDTYYCLNEYSHVAGDYIIFNTQYTNNKYKPLANFDWTVAPSAFNYTGKFQDYSFTWVVRSVFKLDDGYYLGLSGSFYATDGSSVGSMALGKCDTLGGTMTLVYQFPNLIDPSYFINNIWKNNAGDIFFWRVYGTSVYMYKVISDSEAETIFSSLGISNSVVANAPPVRWDVGEHIFFLWDSVGGVFWLSMFDKNTDATTIGSGSYISMAGAGLGGHFIESDGSLVLFAKESGNTTDRKVFALPIVGSNVPAISIANAYVYIKYKERDDA